MRRLAVVIAIEAAILFTASPVSKTDAAAWQGAAKIAPAGPYSAIHPAACGGRDVHCPPGSHWVCGPAGQRCWCTPC
jgi:hypothetical protein